MPLAKVIESAHSSPRRTNQARWSWIAGMAFLFAIAIAATIPTAQAEEMAAPPTEGQDLNSKGGIMTLMDSTPKQGNTIADGQPNTVRPPLENCIVLKNQQVSLAIDRATFTWASMRDEKLGIEYVMEPGGPLCEIQLSRLPGAWFQSERHFSCDGLAAKRKSFKLENSDSGQVLVLSYSDCRFSPFAGPLDIEIRISLAPQDTVFRWNLSIKNRSGLTLENVLFPTAVGFASSTPGSAKTDFIVRGMTSGAKFMNPRERTAGAEGDSEGPASTMSIQAVVYCDGQTDGGLYLAAEDSKWFRKNFICNPKGSGNSFSWYFTHIADGREKKHRWTLPYTVAFGPFRGDWYDAAKEYRKWIKTQPVFVPLKDRKDIPEWFSKLNVWFQGQDTGPEADKMASMVSNLLRIRKELGEDYGWHWYLWQKGRQHDHNYPDYFPAAAGFKEAVKVIQDAGVHAMPYINVTLFETQLPMWKEDNASLWAVRNGNYGFFDSARNIWSRGDLEWVFYLNSDNRKMVSMCPATAYWQDKMASIYGRLVNDEGVDAVYLDQLMVYPYLCYASNHGHAPCGGGDYMAQGFREMIKKIRATSQKQIVLGGENIGESYNDLIDYQLTAHSECAPERIPMYQAALKDYTVEIGLYSFPAAENTPEAFMAKQGLCLVQGRQLGWFNFNVMDYDFTTHQLKPNGLWFMPYLKSLCAARTAAHDFLYYGELVRPPVLKDLPNKDVRWIMWPGGVPELDKVRPVPVVHAQAYQSPGGDLGLVLANWTDEDRSVIIEINQRDWGVAVGQSYQMRTWVNGGWSTPTEQVLGKELPVTVPKLSPMIIQISKKAK
jgi:hypothetical protein